MYVRLRHLRLFDTRGRASAAALPYRRVDEADDVTVREVTIVRPGHDHLRVIFDTATDRVTVHVDDAGRWVPLGDVIPEARWWTA
jgi:hypothetical protein